ncbi:hypothetical protein [Hoeflea sp.]|uniref:hypothetical protein n=1 Tax=Hoeflea sp. TaxID=1940281 RepID=UPI0037495950
MKYLLSARDTGAAEHILALSAGLSASGFDIRLILQGAALELARRRGIKCETAIQWIDEDAPLNAKSLADLGTLLSNYEPEAVICGLSGFFSDGIDEALILAARDRQIRCFAMQDFWGEVKYAGGMPADDYIVLDATAARLTRNATGAKCHIVGSPKHARLIGYDYHAARKTFRTSHRLADDRTVVCLFGQALQHLSGYGSVLDDVAICLLANPGFRLIYKPHPLENADDIAWTVGQLAARGLPPHAVVFDPVEAVLSGCDVALSCFSTVGLDAAYMYRATGQGPVIVYADYPSDITAYWRKESGQTILPPAHDGYALLAKDQQTLARHLAESMNPEVRERLRNRIKSVLPDPRMSVENAIRCLTGENAAEDIARADKD